MGAESTYTTLAREKINILSVAPAFDGVFVCFEYQWLDNKNRPNWAKASMAWANPTDEKWDVNQDIIDLVRKVRKVLKGNYAE